jgi:uncharacterized protein
MDSPSRHEGLGKEQIRNITYSCEFWVPDRRGGAPPLLTTFFGLRQLEAQGLALALVSPSALIALLAYAEAGRVDWLVGLPLALGGIAAISAGVAFVSRLPERRMRLAFCGLLLLTAALLALRG